MNLYRLFAVVGILLSVPNLAWGQPQAQGCNQLSSELLRMQRALYEFASLANYAYGQPDGLVCDDRKTNNVIDLPKVVEVRPLLKADVLRGLWTREYFLEYQQYWQNPAIPEIHYYHDGGGRAYISCTLEPDRAPRVFMTWTQVFLNELASLVFDLFISAVNPIRSQDERLGYTRLLRFDPSGSPEEIYAFKGTDITEIPEIMVTVNDLLRRSCAFDIAAIVVGHGFNSRELPIAVVGHSLGGAAAQHVAKDQELRAGRSLQSVDFSAYSFNSVGLDESEVGGLSLNRLSSYYVDGEVLSLYSDKWNRRQAGHVYRYVPLDGFTSVLLPESIERHKIGTVMLGLCQCINGNGFLDYTVP